MNIPYHLAWPLDHGFAVEPETNLGTLELEHLAQKIFTSYLDPWAPTDNRGLDTNLQRIWSFSFEL